MSSTSENFVPPAPVAPSVFISYASEDRPAARALRDTLTNAGLDVWYDENELTGGDSWDQKIRRQIRDCEYFMPVISATTEARKEGYFRREWRLATDRSLDMADDVLFLVPVAIDGTAENGARVPEKFLTVQWLRAPGGHATPALHHLARRILSGNHQALTRPPMAFNRPPPLAAGASPFADPPPLNPAHPDAAPPAAAPPPLPQMPPFPHIPEKGGFFHSIKFIAETLWWALTAARMLFKRLPRWGRILVTIWLVLTFFSTRGCNPSFSVRDPETQQKIKAPADQFAQAARDARRKGNSADLARVGAEIAKSLGAGALDGGATGKRLVLVPFARITSEEPADKFATAVFTSLYGRLTLTHGRDVGLLRQPPANQNDSGLTARGKALGSSFVLAGHLTGEGNARLLAVHLLVTEDGSTKWTESFPLTGIEPTDVADKIADKLSAVLPHREPPRGKPPGK
ncbi:MAG: toll/interleukin-1 receptor domain-containing protein [Opitutus sp.]|nr:toll/interleukin-1 receptor domain-containing protein [Opitutus sp.]